MAKKTIEDQSFEFEMANQFAKLYIEFCETFNGTSHQELYKCLSLWEDYWYKIIDWFQQFVATLDPICKEFCAEEGIRSRGHFSYGRQFTVNSFRFFR